MKEKKGAAIGIVVEYNPFHYGHLYQIQKIKNKYPDDVLVVIMSGHFVQRGLPAIVSKKERAITALDHGVDIVLELPTVFSLQRADIFAHSAVSLLDYLKIKRLVFGSENPQAIQKPEHDLSKLQEGFSFAKASNLSQEKPNNLLAFFYQEKAKELGIQCIPIKRIENSYHDEEMGGKISSATAIRKAYFHEQDFQKATPMPLNDLKTFHIDDFQALFRAKILQSSAKTMRKHQLMDEGIENLFKKLAEDPYSDLINDAVSKRYTKSRIQRTLMNFYLGIEKKDYPLPEKVRLLAANKKGLAYLSNHKESLRYSSRFKDYDYHQEELQYSMLYALVQDKKTQSRLIQDELSFPIIRK